MVVSSIKRDCYYYVEFVLTALQASGLSKFLGEVLTVFAPLPGWAMTLLIAVLVSLLTEITSNTAVVTVVTPIIIAMVSRPTILRIRTK